MNVREMTEEVKKIPIPKYFYEIIVPELSGYYSDYTVDFELRPVAKCPLHIEDTPSFRWYEETNTFFCFGCRAGGDLINLHRMFIGESTGEIPGFEASIQFLYKRFITGDSSTEIGTKARVKYEIEMSSKTELMSLAAYINNLEKILMIDNNIRLEGKMRIYKAIDMVTNLCGLNIANATEAKKYLSDVVASITK